MEKRENFDKKSFFDKLFARWEKEDEQIKKMIENDEYIKWLEDVTNRFGYVYDEDYLDSKFEINDMKNMELLGKFYKFIDFYAKKNYIYPKTDSSNTSYVIKYGENTYLLESVKNAYCYSYYCAKNIKTECDVIQYEDFKNNVPSEKSKIYTEKLNELEEYIIAMNETVSLEAIESTCNDVMEKIKSKTK